MKKVNTIHEVKRNLDVQLDEESGSGAERNDTSEQDNESGLGSPLNVNCRVEQFGLLMEGLEGEKMDIVESMGFGHLKHLSGQAMNKELGYWLMTRMNADTSELMAGDGREFTLSSEQVQCVLGIPRAKDYVMGEEVDVENLASELTPALCAAEEAKQYDWCSFVLDFLLRRARAFSHSFDKDGYAVGCGGCTYFLVVFYLDRLRWPPVRWGEYPRVKVFDKDLLKNVAEADRRNSGDFGKTKSDDVAYGEVHPQAARHLSNGVANLCGGGANHIGEVIRTEVGVVVDVVSRLLGEQNVRREDGRLCISADRRTTTDDATAKSSIPVTNKVHVSSSTLPPNATITSTTVTANVYGISPSIPSTTKTVLPPKKAKAAIHPTPQNPPNVEPMLNPPIIATSHPCYVDSQYAATSALNTRTWYKKYDSKCTRMMRDLSIAHLILTKRTQEKHKFITKFAEKIDCDVHHINKIFLPVVIQEHWICLLFAVKERTIWVIDSLFPDPLSQHQDAINKLEDVDKARKDLLLRHLLCDFNEKKNELSNIVKLWRTVPTILRARVLRSEPIRYMCALWASYKNVDPETVTLVHNGVELCKAMVVGRTYIKDGNTVFVLRKRDI
ncbi:Serine/threonine-protein kinase WNK1 [Bienertia sinuspersici]